MKSLSSRHAFIAATVVSGLFLLACAKTVVDQPNGTDTNGTDPGGSTTTPTTKKDAGGGSASDDTSGTSSSGGTGSSGSGTTKTPKPGPGSSSGGTSGGTSSSGGTGTGQCVTETTFNTCVDCCSTAHPTGSDTFYGSYINCLCTASVCGSECSMSLCDATNPSAPDATCDACIQANGNDCQADVSAACSADPDCIAFDSCVGDSSCSTKP